MEGNAGSAGEGGQRLAAIADEMICGRNDARQHRGDRGVVVLRQNGVEGRAFPVAGDEDGNVVLIGARMPGRSASLTALRGRSDQRPLKDSRMKVSSASTIPLKLRGLSSAGARRNRCRQRNAVVGWTPHSFAVFARLLPSIIAWA